MSTWYHYFVIAFTLPGGLPIYSFPLLLGIGSSLGLAWVATRARLRLAQSQLDAGLVVLFASLVGSRLAFAAAHWAYFRSHPLEIVLLPLGGLAWPGAVLGALVGLLTYAALKRQPPLKLADALLPLATALSVSAWLACWLDGVAYGPVLSLRWLVPARDEWGAIAPRLPVQFLGALLTLGLFWLLELRQPPEPLPGLLARRWFLCFSLIMLVISLLRADPAPVWLGLRLETWAAMAFLLLAGFALWKLTPRPSPSLAESDQTFGSGQ
jgi:phosphatidylglycerol:prolipoprotein diacylglycerol transferase